MPPFSIAFAIGVSFTRPSDLNVDLPSEKTEATFDRVRWSGQPFVSPLYYVLRFGRGDLAVDFTHYKIYAATQNSYREHGTWKGQNVDDTVRLDSRVQHFEVSHGVNALGLVAIARSPLRRGFYAGIGPVVYLSHSESTIDGTAGEWGYGLTGAGFEAFGGIGLPAPFAEAKIDVGKITVGVPRGKATIPLQTVQFSFAP